MFNDRQVRLESAFGGGVVLTAKRKRVAAASLCALLSAHVAASAATIRFVNATAAPGGNGQTWAAAYINLQDALAEAGSGSIDQIWVAKGTYKPAAASGSRFATFQLRSSLALYGGFAGNEGSLDQRQIAANPTILSGDLNGNDGPNFANNAENSYHVVIGSATTSTAVLDGFTITAGNANGSALDNQRGAGLLCIGGSPTIRNCTLGGNYAMSDGGGAHARLSSSPTFESCSFSGNVAPVRGGALYSFSLSSPTVVNCTFQGNSASRGGAYYSVATSGDFEACSFDGNIATFNGGAVYALQALISFNHCTFDGNSAVIGSGGFGGAVFDDNGASSFDTCTFTSNSAASNSSGGGLFELSSDSTLSNCQFFDNSAGWGGAIYNSNSTTTISDSDFESNYAFNRGGTVYCYLGGSSFSGCAFRYGYVLQGDGHAGAVAEDTTSSTFANCLFDSNSSATGSAGGAVWEYSTNSTFEECEFDSNVGGYGGAISEWYSTIHVLGCTFESNESQINGGALDNFHGTPSYENCSFFANSAPGSDPDGYGGAAHDYMTAAQYSACEFSGNHAGVSGGGAFEYQSDSAFDACDFSDNDAGYAGCVYNSGSATTVTDCIFQANIAHLYGGACVNYGGAPAFVGCRFLSNSAIEGGGVSNYTQSAASFLDCEFSSNAATHFAGAALNSLSMPQYRQCSFLGNSVSQPYPYGFGGAVYNYYDSSRLTDCLFRSNAADYSASGGGIFIYFGASGLVDHCRFSYNIAGYGGGIFDNVSTSSQISNCEFFGNHAVTHSGGGLNSWGADSIVVGCAFSGNDSFFGGGIYCQYGSTTTIVNCSLGGNVSHTGYGAGIQVDASTPRILNSILWGNVNTLGYGEAAQVLGTNGGAPLLTRCCVQNWSGSLGGVGNMGLNPRFRNAAGPDGDIGSEDDDLRLVAPSPAVDRGDNSLVPPDAFDLDADGNTSEPIPLDADGQLRFVRGRLASGPPIVDLGAYEYHGEDLGPWVFALDSAPPTIAAKISWDSRAIGESPLGGSADPAIHPSAGINGAITRDLAARSVEQVAMPQPIPDFPVEP